MRPSRYALVVCLITSLLSVAAPAFADDPYAEQDEDPYKHLDAEAQFKDGVAAMRRRDFDEGCPMIARSFELDPRPGTSYALAECEAQWGRLATAVAHFKQFLRDKLVEHKQYVQEHGDDLPEVKNWSWPY